MKTNRKLYSASGMGALVFLLLALNGISFAKDDKKDELHRDKPAKTLYIWAGDQARLAEHPEGVRDRLRQPRLVVDDQHLMRERGKLLSHGGDSGKNRLPLSDGRMAGR